MGNLSDTDTLTRYGALLQNWQKHFAKNNDEKGYLKLANTLGPLIINYIAG